MQILVVNVIPELKKPLDKKLKKNQAQPVLNQWKNMFKNICFQFFKTHTNTSKHLL
jgi:hypothetical protein